MSQRVNIPWAAWFGDTTIALEFPDHWQVQTYPMRDAPGLSPAEIAAALRNTIGTPAIQELAHGHETVAIAIDDLSRPTPTHAIAPFILEELHAASIRPENITFVVSLGSHTPLTRADLIKKLGREIVTRHRIVNHNCENHLVDLGVSVGKVPVRLNVDFMAADLKILLGSVVPHAFAGFSGGAKMVLPGLSNIEAIEWTHKAVVMGLRGKPGTMENNRFRKEFERVARHSGVQMSINVVVNGKREVAGIFAGDLELAHRKAAEFARAVYSTPLLSDPLDIAILNAYPKDDELLQAENAFMFHHTAPTEYLKDDGLILMTSACSLGMGHHGLFGPAQRLYRPPTPKAFLKERQLSAYMPGVSSEQFHQIYWEGYPHFSEWLAALKHLEQRYPNGARVGIFPWSSIQIADVRQ